VEPPLITSGDDLSDIGDFLNGRSSYSAQEVLDYLLGVEGPDAAVDSIP